MKKNSAFDDGYSAFLSGKKLIDNPYDSLFDSENCELWISGWEQAASECEPDEIPDEVA